MRVLPVLAAATAVTIAAPAAAAPTTPQFGRWADAYSEYEPEGSCSPRPKPGVLALRDMLNRAYGKHTAYMEPPHGCTSGTSEHEDGRALDYMLDVGDPADKAVADDIFKWLLATDEAGNTEAIARRLGLMYIVWNRRIWSSNQPVRGWRAYTGSNPHTDHIHFSFSHDGAWERTSWWSTVPHTHFADLDGDGRAELLLLRANGRLQAWRNLAGLTGGTYLDSQSVYLRDGLEPVGLRFADLDGDGRDDLVNVDDEGSVNVWRNGSGFAAGTFGGEPTVVGRGFDPAQTRFADLNGDGRDEIVHVLAGSGKLIAWRNNRGLADDTYTSRSSHEIGHGFDLRRTKFADLNGDGRAEVVHISKTDEVMAWRNIGGFPGGSVFGRVETVGRGFPTARARLSDVDGDGRDDLVLIRYGTGTVSVWRNGGGFSLAAYGGVTSVDVGSGFTP